MKDKLTKYAAANGWHEIGKDSKGHRTFQHIDANGILHRISIGNASHGKRAREIDADRLRQRIRRCNSGHCHHIANLSKV